MEHVAFIDGEHRVKDIEDVLQAHYAKPNSKHKEKFKQELQEKGYAVRKVGRCSNQPDDVIFKAEKIDEGYVYQCVLEPSTFKEIRKLCNMVTIIDGTHITDNLKTLLLAYYFDSESKYPQRFKEDLEKEGYAVRAVGISYAESIKIFFQAKQSGDNFHYRYVAVKGNITLYRNILVRDFTVPPTRWNCRQATTGGKVVFGMHGCYVKGDF